MLNAVRKIFGGGASEVRNKACSACDPAMLAKCKAPEAGSVTPHVHHVLVRLHPTSDAASRDAREHGAWWPESVDKEPPLEALASCLKEQQEAVGGKVKVTAFDDVAPAGQGPQESAGFEVLVFPAGVRLRDVALEGLGQAVLSVLDSQQSVGGTGQQKEHLPGLTLLVCCHGRRDARCGVLGAQLAQRLVELIREKGVGGEEIRVLKTSHVGGHVYAGNVLVYGADHPCGGDWFGGVNADNAKSFLDWLLQAQECGSAHPQLRGLWRGRVGLSKEEQVALFERRGKGCGGGGVAADIEDLRGA